MAVDLAWHVACAITGLAFACLVGRVKCPSWCQGDDARQRGVFLMFYDPSLQVLILQAVDIMGPGDILDGPVKLSVGQLV